MEWITPEHERAAINAAARVLLKNGSLSEEEQQWASDIVNNWRYAHNYPLNTFKVTLRDTPKKRSWLQSSLSDASDLSQFCGSWNENRR